MQRFNEKNSRQNALTNCREEFMVGLGGLEPLTSTRFEE